MIKPKKIILVSAWFGHFDVTDDVHVRLYLDLKRFENGENPMILRFKRGMEETHHVVGVVPEHSWDINGWMPFQQAIKNRCIEKMARQYLNADDLTRDAYEYPCLEAHIHVSGKEFAAEYNYLDRFIEDRLREMNEVANKYKGQ